ncbi:retinol-binding protein pinta-like [Lutzomyia longipalpis]|uniref:CRAL-TRIO domain-containing protein n=1 Tax=Lutzomyia longipalpis TaxID=7200 RepID=A0A1B0FV49_LUTLO|nr:retinol-binding protein pinta-like [Lutzomyia longipalpis]
MKWRNPDDEYANRPNLRREDVKKILEWISKQPHLPKISELEAILFIHSCYYSLEQAKKTIDVHYTIRTHSPEFFAKRDSSAREILDMTDIQLQVPLPGLTPEGYKIIFINLLDHDASKYNFTASLKLYSFISDLHLWTEGTAEGHILLVNMQGMNLGHIARLGLVQMKKYLTYLQDALPLRIKGLYFINANSVTDKLVSMMKPLMNKELISIMRVFTTMESVYKVIPQEIFPKELGGSSKSYAELQRDMKEGLAANRDFFLEFENQRWVDESKRPGKPKTANDLFGIEGNFKKLDFD